MTREQAWQELKSRYAECLQPAKTRGYVCPFCGNGTGNDGDGMNIDPHSNKCLKCFKCGFYGDVIDIYAEEHKVTTGEAFNVLCERFNIVTDEFSEPDRALKKEGSPHLRKVAITENAGDPHASKNLEATNEAQESQDYTEYYRRCREGLNTPEAMEYLAFRGISLTTAERFWIGYDSAWRSPQAVRNGKNPPASPRLIIPTSSSSYLARDVRKELTEQERKFSKMKEGAAQPFNLSALKDKADNAPVFVTEGEIDALSIIEAGGDAVALGSIGNTGKLIDWIKANGTEAMLLLCLDNDDAGHKAETELAEALQRIKTPHISVNVCGEYKDPNEALTSEKGAFLRAVQSAMQDASKKPDNVTAYINSLMAGEIENFKKGANRKTGFQNLDEAAAGIYPGLYVLGAVSSLGKTTFIHQMADQMAAAGEHVLFFSMEQSRLEMVSKSISRITAKSDVKNAVTSLSIRGGYLPQTALKAARAYTEAVQDRMSVIEGNFNCTVSFIGEYVRRYMESNRVKPIVIVDYLQILQGEQRQNTKELTDSNITELKRISRSLDIPVFVISSLNRTNYLSPIDFESFKESGSIEYTADVVWGLQLQIMNEEVFNAEKKIKEKRDKIREAKAEIPRKVELVCLKNRYGISSYKAAFAYYPQYDLFMPAESEEKTSIKRF